MYQSHLEYDYTPEVWVLRHYLPLKENIKHVYSFYSSYHYIYLKP